MPDVILDIETTAFPLENFDDKQIAYLLKFAEKEETEEKRAKKREELIQNLALYPFTAQVIVIGLLNIQSNKARIFFQCDRQENFSDENGNDFFGEISEADILKKFWEVIPKYDKIITFNGRNFDCPFLMVRSAINRIKPSRNLITNKWHDADIFCDLLEQFTFYGAMRRFSLDFICKVFSIKSPKEEMTGLEVAEMFRKKQFQEIAKYNLGDLYATAELYKIWKEYLR